MMLLAATNVQGLPVWLILILIPLCWFWATQFVLLMMMTDYDFPGRYDKAIWAIALIFLFFIAPFAFWGWRMVYFGKPDEQKASSSDKQNQDAVRA